MAIKLPKSMNYQRCAKVGVSVEVEPATLKLIKPKYKLSNLIAVCNKDAQFPQDDKLWNDSTPVGSEII